MKKAHLFTILIIILPIAVAPTIEATNVQWSYGNYLSDFVILSFDNSVEAGRTGSINGKVYANTKVIVHVEFKGHYSWGEWIYDSEEIQLDPGETVFTAELEIPFKTIVEPTCDFYYYVYVTLPEEEWSSHYWGLAPDADIILPIDITLDDLHEMTSHLAWIVESSDFNEFVKSLLVKRIEGLAARLDVLYHRGELDRIYEILDFILKFRNRFCSINHGRYDYWFELVDCNIDI